MAELRIMPQIAIPENELQNFGNQWTDNDGSLSRSPPYSSMQLGSLFDERIGQALAEMLGDINIVVPNGNSLLPAEADVVEVGPVRVIGAVRPQNFDVGYRPDGIRFAFDSKTLNDISSVRKNYQNMINDLGTEATTVHARFPYAIVAFLVAIPTPCLPSPQKEAITQTLERLTLRDSPLDSNHKAEAISLVLWNPDDGTINQEWPPQDSPLRVEKFHQHVNASYHERYKGMPPHQAG